jgi:hypothetical protein
LVVKLKKFFFMHTHRIKKGRDEMFAKQRGRRAPAGQVWNVLELLLREIGWDGVDWIDLAQDRGQWRALVNTVMNLRVP